MCILSVSHYMVNIRLCWGDKLAFAKLTCEFTLLRNFPVKGGCLAYKIQFNRVECIVSFSIQKEQNKQTRIRLQIFIP
jgi:hypothetical protein